MENLNSNLIFFSFLSILSVTSAGVPSFIHVCGRQNPQVNECVARSMENMTGHLRAGIPELSIPPLEILHLDDLDLMNLEGFRATAYNASLFGLWDLKVNEIRLNFTDQTIYVNATFPKSRFDAIYKAEVRILVRAEQTGNAVLETGNTNVVTTIRYKLTPRKGKIYWYLSSMQAKLTVTEYTAKFTLANGEPNPLSDAINQVVEQNKMEILNFLAPNVEQAMSKKSLEIGNSLIKHFTFDELFPDRK